jgi:hypothetical protein
MITMFIVKRMICPMSDILSISLYNMTFGMLLSYVDFLNQVS